MTARRQNIKATICKAGELLFDAKFGLPRLQAAVNRFMRREGWPVTCDDLGGVVTLQVSLEGESWILRPAEGFVSAASLLERIARLAREYLISQEIIIPNEAKGVSETP
jgi:hypothetical protein